MKTLAALLLIATVAVAAEKELRWDPVGDYHEKKIEGWRVLVNQKLDNTEQRALCDETLKVLGDHLFRITRVVPADALKKLQTIPIWVELAHPRHPCMCYHEDAGWLREHDMNPEKAGAVELANAKTFLAWTRQDQPWMVLHELAHGYQHLFLGDENAEIKACYEKAVASKSYESVLRGGRKERHYALNNPKEYFAESTEAYFGQNDFYPFVRAELKEHDPAMHDLLEKLWLVKKP